MAEKSAGSVLYRGEIYYGATYGDSSLTPSLIDSPVSLKEIDKFHFFSIGPGVGYASTFVYKEHFFLLASANVNLTLRYSNEISTTIIRMPVTRDSDPILFFIPVWGIMVPGGVSLCFGWFPNS